jgi:tetratricopeptide (TPR) repeat protein
MVQSRISITVGPRPAARWVEAARIAVAAGRFGDAIRGLRKASAAEPGNAMILVELGEAHLLAGQPGEALDPLRRAITLDPRSANARLRLGMALGALGDPAGAGGEYEQAAALQPSLAEAHYQLGLLNENFGRPQPALACFRRAVAAAPEIDLRQMAEARALILEGQEEAAAILLRQVLGRQPRNAAATTLLGDILAGLGQFDEAENCFEAGLTLQPHKVALFYNIVRCRPMTDKDGDLMERMSASLSLPGLDDQARSMLELARGKAFEDFGWYDKAMAAFDAAGEARARLAPFDLERFSKSVDTLIAGFDGKALARAYPGASNDTAPVFVLGMPRSGTTLCEHVLGSHPDVACPGELQFWTVQGPTLARTGPRSLEGTFVADTAAFYLQYLRGLSGSATRVVDKTPLNFFWIGLIHMIFPRATIIHCRRLPIDTAVSIHQTAFSPWQRFPTGGAELVGYYRQYQRLMAHWRTVLPSGRMLEVDYETLTRRPENEIRRIIAFTGLEWNDACLRPQDSKRVVRTPSRWQVRQPIHTDSVDRWRRYESFLGPLAALRDCE